MASRNSNSITDLPKLVESLKNAERSLFYRIYRFYIETGRLVLPDAMREWTTARFGECEEQRIVRVTNKVTYESTLFNELRAKRPIDAKVSEDTHRMIEESKGCPFCNPKERTPADAFGRIEGKHCITASNIAKYDYLHAVIIFKGHDPFVCEAEKIADYLDVAFEWFRKANEYDSRAIYPFFMWNCLWRAGASIIHGHAQALISREPYGRQEFYENVRKWYAKIYGSEYFEDVYAIHEALGLGFMLESIKIMAYLTPVKEKEVVMISSGISGLAEAIGLVLKCYHRLGVRSFNVAVFMPPLGSEDIFITRIVDRGDPSSRTADVGGMELYAGTSVVASDPFRLVEELRSEI
ncbi:hypothetical protein [Archaeoglobus veneficus]|nr:hypothetical protein [Archaeoglobus veneficus]